MSSHLTRTPAVAAFRPTRRVDSPPGAEAGDRGIRKAKDDEQRIPITGAPTGYASVPVTATEQTLANMGKPYPDSAVPGKPKLQ